MSDDDKVTPFPTAGERLVNDLKKQTAPLLDTMVKGMLAAQDAMVECIGFKMPPDLDVFGRVAVHPGSLDSSRPAILRVRDLMVTAELYGFVRHLIPSASDATRAAWETCLDRLDALVEEHGSLAEHMQDEEDLRFFATTDELHDAYGIPQESRALLEDALALSLTRLPIESRRHEWSRGDCYARLLDAIHLSARPDKTAADASGGAS